MKEICSKTFSNGAVYALATSCGSTVETTDTFLPFETINAIGRRTNKLLDASYIGSRKERWMIGISTMSGCPVKCKFCATAKMKTIKYLSANEMIKQVEFIVAKNPDFSPAGAKEFKVLFTRMGEPALNGDAVICAIRELKKKYPNITAAVSTIGMKNDFLAKLLSLKKEYGDDFIQLQFSVHSTSANDRDWLQPVLNKMTFRDINEFAKQWVNKDSRKITLNFTITEKTDGAHVRKNEFDAKKLARQFDKNFFFIKLSPLNSNDTSRKNNLVGVIKERNLR